MIITLSWPLAKRPDLYVFQIIRIIPLSLSLVKWTFFFCKWSIFKGIITTKLKHNLKCSLTTSRQNILAISSQKMSTLNIVSWWRNGAPEAPRHILFSASIFKFCPSVTHHLIHWMNEMLESKTFTKIFDEQNPLLLPFSSVLLICFKDLWNVDKYVSADGEDWKLIRNIREHV